MKIKVKAKTLSPLLPLAVVAFVSLIGILMVFKAERMESEVKDWVAQYVPSKTSEALMKSEMQTAVTVLDGLNGKYEKGEMSLMAAQKLGAEILTNLKYGDDNKGYFWVQTRDGVGVVKNVIPPSRNTYSVEYQPWGWIIGTVYHQ